MIKPPKGWIACKRQAGGELHVNVERIDYFEALPTNPASTRVQFGGEQIVVEMNPIDFARELAATNY